MYKSRLEKNVVYGPGLNAMILLLELEPLLENEHDGRRNVNYFQSRIRTFSIGAYVP